MSRESQQFLFISNNIALDFVNTVVAIRGRLVDLLQDRSNLIDWLNATNLCVDISKVDSSLLDSALELRATLRNILTAKIDSVSVQEKDLAIVNQYLSNHSTQKTLFFESGEYVLQPAQKTLTSSMLLGVLAYEAASLIASTQSQQIKRCKNNECQLIFLDTSRSRKRQWCSMDVCGNRAKVATHYKKTMG